MQQLSNKNQFLTFKSNNLLLLYLNPYYFVKVKYYLNI